MSDDLVEDEGYGGAHELEQDDWNFSEWAHHNFDDNPPPAEESLRDDVDSVSSVEGVTEDIDWAHREADNEYLRKILRSVDLKILKEALVARAFDGDNREADLFHLFLTKDYLSNVTLWTNEMLTGSGRKSCSDKEFLAYVGLELGMSLLKFNDIKKYWAKGSFLGHETFRETMSRNRFQKIRASVRFISKAAYDPEGAASDPLWYSRSLLDQFIKKSASIAVPLGASALDENSCPTKARTRAKTYCPNKPAKYAIRFYAVVGHQYCYMSTMYDNRAGNTTGISGIDDYNRVFPIMKAPYNNIIKSDRSKDSLVNTPSALWISMMGQQCKRWKQPNGLKRYFFTDNFYTRHVVASTLKKFTDDAARIIGTVKFTNVDGTNRYHLSKAMEMLKDQPRGSWALVQVYDKNPDYERLRNQHAAQQKRVRAGDKSPFVPPLDRIADKAGFIVFKDSKIVLFYTNDLIDNPPCAITMHTDERAVHCVGGLAKVSRWTGTEVLHRTDFWVAAPIVAYNMFMNGVDRMDQYRATLATQRKEQRVHMTLFTYILDLCVTQAYAIYRKMCQTRRVATDSYFNFKRSICSTLIAPWKSKQRPQVAASHVSQSIEVGDNMSQRESDEPINDSAAGLVTIDSTLGTMDGPHMLVENLPRKSNNKRPQDIDCYLCRRMNRELKTIYSCIQCKKGFHVNCFTAFHYRGVLSTRHSALLDIVFNSDHKPTVGKPSKYAPTNTDHMHLPTEKDKLLTRALIRTKANVHLNRKRKADNDETRHQRKLLRLSSSEGV